MCRMGKTIQMIALLLSDIGAKPNLVVAYVRLQLALTIITESACRPTVAIMQWRNEIELHTDNLLKTLVWHGSSRESSVQELKKYDVVLTTYQTVAKEHDNFGSINGPSQKKQKTEKALFDVRWKVCRIFRLYCVERTGDDVS